MPQSSQGLASMGATGTGAPAGKSLVVAQKLQPFLGLEFCIVLLSFKSPLQGQVSVCTGAQGICVLADKRKAVN